MILPEYILGCISALERAGFQAWAVGGCVRDSLLGITPHDYDLCTSALPEQTQAVFAGHHLVLTGVKHGTVGVVTGGVLVEITTFRTEGDYTDLRHPGWVKFVPEIQSDLSRRDFTVNAMAYSPTRGYADPFGGREDLENGILRAVGDPVLRFQEDALRILRGIRFAARFGLSIEPATWDAMVGEMSGLDALAVERVYSELTRFLCLCDQDSLLRAVPILCRVIPELAACVGFDQQNPHHQFDVFTHTAHVVANTPADPALRWAALLHDAGKPGTFSIGGDGFGHFYNHHKTGAEIADAVLRRLKAPTQLREEVVWLIHRHMALYPLEERSARRCLSRWGLEKMERLLALQIADRAGTAHHDDADLLAFRSLLRDTAAAEGQLNLKTLAVRGGDLIAIGYTPGRDLGSTLNALLEQVLDGRLPNEKEALLNEAETMKQH